ncbi:MAG: DUF2207 domain-containing protein [bacterium]
MRKIAARIMLLLSLFLPIVVQAQTEEGINDFDISKYSADIEVLSNSTVHVRESIDVRFFVGRHGIFRKIPVDYKNDSGNNVSIKVKVASVTANGEPTGYTTSRESEDLVIKIGDANKLVKGVVKYEIAYDVTRVLLSNKATDELYWNVTGSGWPVIPKKTIATIKLPSGVDSAKVEISCYTGEIGSTSTNCTKSVVEIDGRAVVKVEANDFLTIAARFPSGSIKQPSILTRLFWFANDNKVVAMPFVIFILLFLYWYRNGRDPKPLAIVAEFEAPEGMTPGEVGALEDGKVHDRDLSATIIDLAVRGYLKIIETEKKGILGTSKSFAIERTEKPLDGLKQHETSMLTGIMGSAMRREISELQSRAKEVKAGREAAQKFLYEEMVSRKWFVGNPETVRNLFYVVATVLVVAAIWFVSGISIAWMISMIISAIIFAIFGTFMPKRTEAGTREYEKIMGFKEYLSRAEKYRLKWQESENVFQKFLPYAMVFLVVDKWSVALKDVIRTQDWYQSSHPGAFDYLMFNSAMHDLNRSLNSAVATTPQKSASSGGSGIGGGFSGGGFGGGGGGSW